MAVITCAEMVAQCLEGQEAGWRHFIAAYLPFSAAVVDRRFPQLGERREATLREALRRAAAQEAQFLRDYAGHSEREFLLHLREHTIRVAGEQPVPGAEGAPEIPLAWEVFEKALAGLTALERQIVWLFVLSPNSGDTDKILRLDPPSVAADLAKAQEALRAACDRWSAEMLAENRLRLAQEARAHHTSDCPAPKAFLRLLDGQISWRDRSDLEHHMAACWHCVDLLCRFREIMFLSRQTKPFPETETEAYLKLLDLQTARPSGWKRLLGKR